jgi:cell division protein FtsZ
MVYLVENEPGARIKVIGAGGCGGNAINHMIASGLTNVDFISVNTDSQALLNNAASMRLQIGQVLTRGRGTGGNPELGRKAALEDEERLRELLAQAEMVFVTAGMGGGTGTGSAPVIARFARESGALTVGVVTKPFLFEGRKRASQADEGVRELKDAVDTLITIPNDRLLSVASRTTTLKEAFQKADDVLLQAVRGIAELVTVHGLINLDFADVRSVMADMGMALMGTAYASGENRAAEAAQRAISSPLLENMSIRGARGLLINVTGGPDMSLYEVNEAASLIQEQAHEEANIIFGAVIDEQVSDEIHVTVVATGFGEQRQEPARGSSRHSPLWAVPDATIMDGAGPASHPVQVQAVREVSTPAAAPPQLVERQPVPDDSILEAPTPPSAAHNGTFNGNGKPVWRLGLVDESRLDITTFKQRDGAQNVAASKMQNRPEKNSELDPAQIPRKPDELPENCINPAREPVERPCIPDSYDPATSTPVKVSSDSLPRQAPVVKRRMVAILNQIWPPIKGR